MQMPKVSEILQLNFKMKKINLVFLFLVSSILLVNLFIFSENFESEDILHQKQFTSNYGIYSLVKPKALDFAGESIPFEAPEIWERLDKELLKNTYWQSNTMLYFKRANKYFPIIEPILKQHNIPEDFKYLAVIESGLDNVVSPAGAAGFWQILKGTAREHGLEVNSSIDERYNLEKATLVACEYLQQAYDKFGSWTMAAASYNMGRNGARRKINEQSSNNYYNLHLNSETAHYVFRIIAIKEIFSNPRNYGFVFRERDLYKMQKHTTIDIDSTIPNLSEFAKENGTNYKLLKSLNPWLRAKSLPDKSRKKYVLKIPQNSELSVFRDFKSKVDRIQLNGK